MLSLAHSRDGGFFTRVSKKTAAANRDRILIEAARLFRERGLSGVGVEALTEAAGLTYGSLYSHFGSKEALIAETVDQAFANFKFDIYETLKSLVAAYLSPDHRDDPGHGCIIAALGSEIPRQNKAIRHAFTDAVRKSIARLAGRLPPATRRRERDDDALATLSVLVGAIILARGVDDPQLSDRILSAARSHIKETM